MDAMALFKEAKERGIPPDKYEEFLKQKVAEEKSQQEDVIQVQIMPGNAIGGYGRFPGVVNMPRQKAEELAMMGKVKVIVSDDDVIDESDREAIKLHIDEMMALRAVADRKTVASKTRVAQFTNADRADEVEPAKEEPKKGPGRPSGRKSRRDQ